MSSLAAVLAARVLEGATGAVDWSDGKRRRMIFLDRGAVVLIQSNLRSESAERVTESTPGLAGEELNRSVGRIRLTGALKESAGEAHWIPAVTAPRLEPADFSDALWVVGVPRPPITAYARVTGSGAAWVGRQMMAGDLARYLCELDGTRTIDEVYAFAPGGPEAVERWVRIGFAIGAFLDAGIEASTYEVRSINKNRTWSGGVDDIASLISEGLGEGPLPSAPRPEVDPVEARLGPMAMRIRGAADHFAVLGSSWQDPSETLRRAYFTLARELHPDRFVEDPDEVQAAASELFDRVRAAWEVLGDDGKRAAYIAKVVRGEKTEEELTMEKVRTTLDAEQDFKRGLSEYYAGRLAQAHELFLHCASRVPDDAEFAAYAGYTTFKINLGRDEAKAEEGVQRLAAALQTAEKLDSGWVLMGLVHRARKNEPAAKEAFVAALKLKPANPDALRELKRMDKDRERNAPQDTSFFGRFFKKSAKDAADAKKK